jgi:hypothetical protein
MIKYNQIHRMLTRTIEHCGHLERLEVASGPDPKGNKNDDWVGMVNEKTGIVGNLMAVPRNIDSLYWQVLRGDDSICQTLNWF